jgi:hypothetical protein
MGRERVHTGFWWGDLREGDHCEDLGADGKILFKLFFSKWYGGTWTGLSCLRIGRYG